MCTNYCLGGQRTYNVERTTVTVFRLRKYRVYELFDSMKMSILNEIDASGFSELCSLYNILYLRNYTLVIIINLYFFLFFFM